MKLKAPAGLPIADYGVILAVLALFWLAHVSERKTAIVGIVSNKDPCAGLTGATYTACRKIHPIKKTGITPAKPKPKQGITPATPKPKPKPQPQSRFKNVNRPIRTPPVAKTPLKVPPRQNIVYNPTGENYKKNRCEEAAQLHTRLYAIWHEWDDTCREFQFHSGHYADDDPKMFSCSDYECGKKLAQSRQKKRTNTQLDSTMSRLPDKHGRQQSDKYGEESTDRPVKDFDNGQGNFVNNIIKGLQDMWNNLTQGKTAIGGQPTVLTGSPSAPVVRPVITPVA